MSTQGPEKWRRVLRERSFGPSPRKLGLLSPGRAGGKVAVWPRRQRIGLRARSRAPRPFPPASAAARAESPRPGRSQATVGGQRRAVSPPPARPQGRGRCQGDGTCRPRGLGSFRAPCISAARRSQPLSRGRSKGAEGRRRASYLPAGQGRNTGGTKTPGTTTVAAAAATGSASPEARPLVGSCHYPGYGPSLRSTDLSLPPRRPVIRLLSGERKCAFPDRVRLRKLSLGGVLV